MSDFDIFEFEKSCLERMDEIGSIVCCSQPPVPASKVRTEWSHYIEIAIEPAGWQALWRIPRVICEELGVKYPTIVLGVVDQVLFAELKAVFTITAVQDDNVHLPEHHEVALQELWPTKNQENTALDVERTASCVDMLRFFYNHVFMPWDYDMDDDVDWSVKHLRTRICFYYDLKNGVIDRGLASRISLLLSEAHYIQKRKEYLELDLSDVEEDQQEPLPLTDLTRMHLRLNIIKNELEMLENPEMRKIYKNMEFSNATTDGAKTSEVIVVAKTSNLTEQIEFLSKVKSIVNGDLKVQICARLQDALTLAGACDQIFIPAGQHSIKFLEHLNEKGAIKGVGEFVQSHPNRNGLELAKDAVIKNSDDDSILLSFDGDFTLENLVLDCRNVRTGLMIRNGRVRLANCLILGDGQSTTKQGIVIAGSSTLVLENCVIKDFSTGIYANRGVTIEALHCTIEKCMVAIECVEECELSLTYCDLTDSKQYGVVFQANQSTNGPKVKTFADFADLTNKSGITCDNVKLINNKYGNWAIRSIGSSILNGSCFDDNDLENSDIINSSYYSECSESSASYQTSVILIEDSLIEVD